MSNDQCQHGELLHARTYYRSMTAAGSIWCESRDPREVLSQTSLGEARGKGPFTYQRLDVYETTHGWKMWDLKGST